MVTGTGGKAGAAALPCGVRPQPVNRKVIMMAGRANFCVCINSPVYQKLQATTGLLLDHFHDVVRDGLRDLLEPMRYAGRDDDDVAFAEVIRLSARHVFSALLAWTADASTDHRAAGDQSGRAIENVKGVGFLVM